MNIAIRVLATLVVILAVSLEAPAAPPTPDCSALQFDGQNDYVEIPHSESLKPQLPITISAWIKPASTGTNQWIMQVDDRSSNYNGIAIHIRTDGRVFCNFYDGGPPDPGSRRTKLGTTPLAIGVWQHVTAVLRAPTDMSIYINGVDDGGTYSGSGGPLAYTPNGSSFIGNDSGYKDSFHGIIDEVAMYNIALSPAEILANMQTKLTGSEAGLIGYWNFDQGSGQLAIDSSGNANHGQLGSTPSVDDDDPMWVESDAPVENCANLATVALDIKPGTCRNPLNLKSRGVLSVALLGSADFDAATTDPASIRLEGVAPLRSALQDVSNPNANGDDCQCRPAQPDGYTDLTLKFSTQEIVESLVNSYSQLANNEILSLELTANLYDGTAIAASDCVVLVGNISRWLAAQHSDLNADGAIDILDFAELASYWLESEDH